jgi:hypothetical protein
MSKQTDTNPFRFYVYVYLDPRKPGHYKYGEYHFVYEPFYVGKGCDRRVWRHLNENKENPHFNNKIKIIQRETLGDPYVIFHKENILETDAYSIESRMVNTIGRTNIGTGPLCNITEGGYGFLSGDKNVAKKPMVRKKISDALSGDKHYNYGNHLSEELKQKLSDANIGRKPYEMTDDARKKMSESKSGDKHPNYGKHLSETTRKKIGDSHRGDKHYMYGKKVSKETLDKRRESYNLSDDSRERMRIAQQKRRLTPLTDESRQNMVAAQQKRRTAEKLMKTKIDP